MLLALDPMLDCEDVLELNLERQMEKLRGQNLRKEPPTAKAHGSPGCCLPCVRLGMRAEQADKGDTGEWESVRGAGVQVAFSA